MNSSLEMARFGEVLAILCLKIWGSICISVRHLQILGPHPPVIYSHAGGSKVASDTGLDAISE